MDVDVIDRRHRQVGLQRLPVRAIVLREKHAALGGGVEQAFALAVHAHGVHKGACWNAVGQRSPGLAEVGGLEDVRSKVVHLVPLHRHVGRARVVGRGFNHAYRAPLRHGLGRNVRPVFAAVGGHVNQAVVRAGPDQVFLRRRLHHGEDGAIHLHAGVVLGDGTAGRLLLALFIAREIRADGLPVHAFVRGLEQHLGGKIKRVRVVG